jgi:probable rRNA maturation factor
MNIIEVNNFVKAPFNREFIKKIIQNAFKKLKIKKAEISIALVDERTIREINKVYRGINKTTSVLSFNYTNTKEHLLKQSGSRGSKKPPLKGEIIICWPQVKKQAREQSHSIKKEIEFLLLHSLQHLLSS